MYNKVKETVTYIQEKTAHFQPEIAIILGSGLGGLVDSLNAEYSLDYKEIPNFPTSTVQGHKGKLLFGILNGKKVVIMQGRFHYYEGYTMKEVTFPIYIFQSLGVKNLVVSNAAGGVNLNFQPGDIMLISDHINLLPNPLIGPNDERFGPRFPSLHEAYNSAIQQKARDVADEMGIKLQKGVYVGLSGPSFETRAEYTYLRCIGGDAAGMSTTPETIVANYLGIRVMGVSVIANVGDGNKVESSHKEVLDAVEKAMPVLIEFVKKMIRHF